MVVDTSVLLAILFEEPESARLVRAILASPSRYISVASLLEAHIVVQSRVGDEGTHNLNVLLSEFRLTAVPVTEGQVTIAQRANRVYGKGQGHAARLNYGDLFSYALAQELGEALLYKGQDFVHTDVPIAEY